MEFPNSEKVKEVTERDQTFMDDVIIPREREALAKGERLRADVLLNATDAT